MQTIIDIYKKTGSLHHAYLIEGKKEDVFAALHDMFENEMNFPTRGNPDFWCGEFDTFGIDDGREIKERQTREPIAHDLKIFIISANSLTTEAQNSLLKVFEEPTEGTHFFIITQNADTLLPTLRSRMYVISRQKSDLRQTDTDQVPAVDVDSFLKSAKAKRLLLLEDIIREKDKTAAIFFLNELEVALHNKFGSDVSKSEFEAFKEIIMGKKYLNGRAPSVKMILEHIVLVTP